MSRPPEFSIIIPTYNRLGLLKEALGSVCAQTHDDYELIVVDDGSTDGTGDYIASLRGHVKAVRQHNKGPAAARNLGVSQAKGDYVAFLDSDDVWFPWTLAIYHKLIQGHRPSIISAAALEFEGKLPDVKWQSIVVDYFDDYLKTALKPGSAGTGMLVIKRSIFNLVGGFKENMVVGEDQDFYLRTGTVSGFVCVRSPLTLAYRRHEDNISRKLPLFALGVMQLLISERKGDYPGGKARQVERWHLLSRTVRPVALSCLRAGRVEEAWRLYWKSFWMNARLWRIRFLIGFLFTACRV